MLYPPYRECARLGDCHGTVLDKEVRVFCRIYTKRRGILPAYEVSLYCRKCHTRYHYSYSVKDPSMPSAVREYYAQFLPYVQAQQKAFVEVDLCEYFEYYMCLSHTSTANLARIYNTQLGRTPIMMSTESALLPEIAQDTVMDAFFMNALLRRHMREDTCLILPHNTVHHEHRFDHAMDLCNIKMAGTGQPQYLHACHDCMKFLKRADGSTYYIRGGTTDGVTLGHPCCSQTNCQQRLLSSKDRFCETHRHLATQCHVIGCTSSAEASFITCALVEHRVKETEMQKARQPAFDDLNRRLQKGEVPQTPRRRGGRGRQTTSTLLSLISSEAFDDTDRSSSIWDESVKGTGRQIRLRTTRRWTHNEQLFVLSCGVIVSRATFYSHEGPASSIQDFLKITFPHPWLLPTHIFFDKACLLLKHLRAQGDTFFDAVRLVVDVFHARNHHKEDDKFCNEHNNPALFAELRICIGGKEKWTLNSSIAEQTNVWFGAFQAITREMSVPRYNFFLDEMILVRNQWLVQDLERRKKQPFIQSEQYMREEYQAMYPGVVTKAN
ncbi:hypothetical protein GGX14DRAFT_372934 [Mycena pura]|uniref:CxC6 like cysteine cluster associated with KDZ domain-containing protein n=1 Tax=Mycena pura TaxID=153505 RepID=A0AAD6Y3L2_9AGAR|nr:hypothetical protein GGX14DRAFT_372934 [Mycena pura]